MPQSHHSARDGLPDALRQLLDRVVPVERRWIFVRRAIEAHGGTPPATRSADGWHLPLAEVPVQAVFSALRHGFPAQLAQIDALEARLVPMNQRVGRVVAHVPTHLCLVGRQAFLDSLLEHPVVVSGGHLELVGGRGSGRSLVAAQLARALSDRLPVVAWIDGRCAEGLHAGCVQLAEALGHPPVPAAERSGQLREWIAGNSDWAVIVDDCGPAVPSAFVGAAGRVITVTASPGRTADAHVHVPSLDLADRHTLVRRWSRRKASMPEAFVASTRLADLTVVAAAHAQRTPAAPTVAAALQVLSPDAQALHALFDAYGPAPIPAALYCWPRGRPPPPDAPIALQPLLRSERVMRAAATELVRGGWAHWVGDALLRGAVGTVPTVAPWAHTMAAVLVEQALADHPRLPASWRPHVAFLADNPHVAPALRRALATRAGRLSLDEQDPVDAVEWFQRAFAACAGDPDAGGQVQAGLLNDLGVAWRRAGRINDAAAVLCQALQHDEHAVPQDPLALASTQANLGHVRREQGDYTRARSLYLAAHAARRVELGPSHPLTAAVAIQLGVAAHALGDVSEARLAWTEAITVLTHARPPARALLASALRHLARLEAASGDLALAVRCADRAHGLLMAEHDDVTHPEVAALRREISDYDRRLDR